MNTPGGIPLRDAALELLFEALKTLDEGNEHVAGAYVEQAIQVLIPRPDERAALGTGSDGDG